MAVRKLLGLGHYRWQRKEEPWVWSVWRKPLNQRSWEALLEELDLSLEGSGLTEPFGREWCVISFRRFGGVFERTGSRSQGNFATVPRLQELKVRPGAVAVRREEGRE